MAILKYIKLKPHKGLKSVILSELEKINVICGPNNSGKTTVLECIESQKLHIYGKPLDAESLVRIDQRSMKDKHWNQNQFAVAYPKMLTETASQKPAWFIDEANSFWNHLVGIWQQQFGYQSIPGTQLDVSKAYLEELNDEPSVVLIPAKRRLETSKQVNAYENIQPDGTGILNFLFMAKNKDEKSSVRSQFAAIFAAFQEISGGMILKFFSSQKMHTDSRRQPMLSCDFAEKTVLGFRPPIVGLGFRNF